MSYIVRNNVKYATGGSGGGNLNIVKLTQAEYDALPDSKNSDGILYAIEDGEISSSGGSAKAITISQEDFDKLSEEEKANGIYVIPDGEDLTAKNLFYDGSETGLGNTVQDAIDELNSNIDEQYKNFKNHTNVILQKSPGENINHIIPEDGLYLLYARNHGADIYINIYINDVRVCANAHLESGSAFTMTCKTLQKNDVVNFLCDQGWYDGAYSEIGIIKLL